MVWFEDAGIDAGKGYLWRGKSLSGFYDAESGS